MGGAKQPAAAGLAGGLLYLFAYNPAIMSPDSMSQWHQAVGLEPLVDWHPAFHTLLIRVLAGLVPSPGLVALAQIIFFAAVFSSALQFLYRRGISFKALILGAAVLVLIPTNGMHLVTLWKDVPYGITLLWLTVILARLITEDYERLGSWLLPAELGIALVLVFLLRQNGVLVYIIMATALAVILIRKRKYAYLFVIAVSLAVALLIIFPLYDHFDVEPAPPGNKYFALVNDLAGVKFSGAEIPRETGRFLDEVLDLKRLEPVYSPYRANYDFYQPELHRVEPARVVKIYSATLFRNPGQVVGKVLQRLDLYWNIATGRNAYIGALNTREISNWEQFEIHFKRNPNFLTSLFNLLSTATVYLAPGLILFWRFGFWLLLLFCVFLYNIAYKRAYIIILGLPILANLFSLALSSGWLDYRYGWSILITVPFILAVSFSDQERDEPGELR